MHRPRSGQWQAAKREDRSSFDAPKGWKHAVLHTAVVRKGPSTVAARDQ